MKMRVELNRFGQAPGAMRFAWLGMAGMGRLEGGRSACVAVDRACGAEWMPVLSASMEPMGLGSGHRRGRRQSSGCPREEGLVVGRAAVNLHTHEESRLLAIGTRDGGIVSTRSI